MIWWILNVVYIIAFVLFYRHMRTRYNWFTDKHVPVPEWVAFAISLCGIFIPLTPFFIDGMIIGTIVYFMNEGVYRSTGWSPITDTYLWLRNRVSPKSKASDVASSDIERKRP